MTYNGAASTVSPSSGTELLAITTAGAVTLNNAGAGAGPVLFSNNSNQRLDITGKLGLSDELLVANQGRFTMSTALTNITSAPAQLYHDTSGSVAIGFGTKLEFFAESTTSTGQALGNVEFAWTEATHATRKSEMKVNVYEAATLYEAASFSRVAVQIGISGQAIGLYGTTAVAQASAITAELDTLTRNASWSYTAAVMAWVLLVDSRFS